MRHPWLFSIAAGLLLGVPGEAAVDPARLRVLYIGEPDQAERTSAFNHWLSPQVASVTLTDHDTVKPEQWRDADVVVLEWHQNGRYSELRREPTPEGKTEHPLRSPIGSLNDWNRPLLVIGSASYHIARVWPIRGDFGCTCLEPIAVNLRPHPLFDGPLPVAKPTPQEVPAPFVDAPGTTTAMALALTDAKARDSGWMAAAWTFSWNPELEIISGGINRKDERGAGAIWRQGNILHWGFEPSVDHLNVTGRNLLFNAIVYISRFTEDRVIYPTPDFRQGRQAVDRNGLRWALANPQDSHLDEWYLPRFTPALAATIGAMKTDPPALSAWAIAHVDYVVDAGDQFVEHDPVLEQLRLTWDDPRFIPTMIDRLADPATHDHALRRLKTNVAAMPDPQDPVKATAWWQAHRHALFPTEASGYQWRIDPLALARGVPTTDLRGPARADDGLHRAPGSQAVAPLCTGEDGACVLPPR